MRRILMGRFGEVLGQAIRLLLGQMPHEIVVTSAESITLPLLEDVRPDVILVDLDEEATLPAIAELSAGFPEVAVIACSAEEPFMMVFPPFHGGEFYGSVLTLETFTAVVTTPGRAPEVDPRPTSWDSVVLDAAQLRLTAKLTRAWSRRTRRQAAELQRAARTVLDPPRDGDGHPTR